MSKSKVMTTIKRHCVIDGKNHNAFVIEDVTPTRKDGRWNNVTQQERLTLIDSVVAYYTGQKDTSGAVDVIANDERKETGGKPTHTYRKRLSEKMDSVLLNGATGVATLHTDWQALRKQLASQLKDKRAARKGTTAPKKAAKHAATKKRLPKRGPATPPKAFLSPKAADEEPFDPDNEEDAREHIERRITQRRGQKRFRDSLISAYEGKCVITGCSILDILEAAHIIPYLGEHTDKISNGLLLRADLHTLFDCGLLAIDPETKQVLLAPPIKDSEYQDWCGRRIHMPKNKDSQPNKKALRKHLEDCRSAWEKGVID